MSQKSDLLAKRFGNIVEGPQGLHLPEAIARRIESVSKTLPKDFTYRRVAKTADAFEMNDGERTDVSYITTDAVDRQGEVVLPSGGDWSGFNKVVPFAHDYAQLPAGSSWWIRPKSKGALNGLVAKTHYPDKPADWSGGPWLPSAILHMMQQPVPTCTGKSIGFLPLNIRGATADEITRRPELKGKPIIDRWMGLEYSVAPIPCNQPSEMIAVSRAIKGIPDPDLGAIMAAAYQLTLKDGADDSDGGGVSMDAMKCPTGHGIEALMFRPAGKVYCKACGKEYETADMIAANDNDGDAAPEKSASVTVHPECEQRTHNLIASGEIDRGPLIAIRGEFDQADCLGSNKTYRILQGGKVCADAVRSALAKATEFGISSVAASARKIVDAITAKEKSIRLEAALAAPYYTEDEIKANAEREQREMSEWAKSQTQARIADALILASGKV